MVRLATRTAVIVNHCPGWQDGADGIWAWHTIRGPVSAVPQRCVRSVGGGERGEQTLTFHNAAWMHKDRQILFTARSTSRSTPAARLHTTSAVVQRANNRMVGVCPVHPRGVRANHGSPHTPAGCWKWVTQLRTRCGPWPRRSPPDGGAISKATGIKASHRPSGLTIAIRRIDSISFLSVHGFPAFATPTLNSRLLSHVPLLPHLGRPHVGLCATPGHPSRPHHGRVEIRFVAASGWRQHWAPCGFEPVARCAARVAATTRAAPCRPRRGKRRTRRIVDWGAARRAACRAGRPARAADPPTPSPPAAAPSTLAGATHCARVAGRQAAVLGVRAGGAAAAAARHLAHWKGDAPAQRDGHADYDANGRVAGRPALVAAPTSWRPPPRLADAPVRRSPALAVARARNRARVVCRRPSVERRHTRGRSGGRRGRAAPPPPLFVPLPRVQLGVPLPLQRQGARTAAFYRAPLCLPRARVWQALQVGVVDELPPAAARGAGAGRFAGTGELWAGMGGSGWEGIGPTRV